MDSFLKFIPAGTLFTFLPWILLKIGNAWKNKDDNSIGTDDEVGDIFIAAAPAVEALSSSNESTLLKGLTVFYTTLGNYLKGKGVKL